MPNDEGVYKCGRLTSYFGDPDRRGYLISWQHAPAGFAFVQGLLQEPRMIGDFFVVRGARRRGVGAAVARELLGRHPGRWEIGFQDGNHGAPDFWRRVVTDAVGDRWREELRAVPDKPHIPPDRFICLAT